MQIEEATRAASSHPPRQGPEVEKMISQSLLRKNLSYNSSAIYKPPRRALESGKERAAKPDLVPFRLPIDHVFNTTKDQSWVKSPADRSRRTRRDWV